VYCIGKRCQYVAGNELTQGRIDMAKLVVWIARQNDDHACYNVVAKTRKACLELVAKNVAQWNSVLNSPPEYESPIKREIHYQDAFDLWQQATSEDGGRA
jgi:hypothetical protein